ncbi:MAG TPA: hypothetical protein VJB87_02440 [Candidatus Nanoarchaeia archaeon]|nr:hypothetical protein [Candidatus Nanoarchaeia archaeon]
MNLKEILKLTLREKIWHAGFGLVGMSETLRGVPLLQAAENTALVLSIFYIGVRIRRYEMQRWPEILKEERYLGNPILPF